jgi:hypothetical protein
VKRIENTVCCASCLDWVVKVADLVSIMSKINNKHHNIR